MILLYKIRNSILKCLYRFVLKPIYFKFDPEDVHDFMIKKGVKLGNSKFGKGFISFLFNFFNDKLEQKILNIDFKNPIGLAAGFDKNAQLTKILPSLGFSFAELGSITGEVCKGNPKPRLWRMPKSKSLQVYYGLKNDGAKNISSKLLNQNFDLKVGISIAKTNSNLVIDLKSEVLDYLKAYKLFDNVNNDYFTINISCPNAFGGQPFTDPIKLDSLLKNIENVKVKNKKPIFIKLSPDLDKKKLDELLAVISKYKVDGIICSNLTKKFDNSKIKDIKSEKGGISGKVVEDLANELLAYIFQKTQNKYILIGCGGVFSAENAYKKIKLGASLIQLISGMIFVGPQLISSINLGLLDLLKKDGFENISDAIGVDNDLFEFKHYK